MERPHDPQYPVVGAPAPSSSIEPVSVAITSPLRRPGRFLVFRRATRLLFRRWLYAMTLVFRWMRPFAGFIAIVVVLLGVVAWMATQLWWPASAPAQDMRVASLQPAPAIQTYLQGQQSHNADLIWQAYSPSFQATELQRGVTKVLLQAQADTERQNGWRYGRADYIGGIKLDSDHSMYFYTVDLTVNAQQFKTPFIFVADLKGELVQVQPPFLPSQKSNQ